MFFKVVSNDFHSYQKDIFTDPFILSFHHQLTATVLLAVVASAAHIDRDAHITEQRSEVNYDGTYSNSFQTSNGISFSESGLGGVVSNGDSQYYDPQGQLHHLTWTADKDGYKPSGADLPTPPPIPSYIIRALEYIRTHPPKEQY